MKNPNKPGVLVDVDGTLIEGPSSERAFIYFLALKGKLGIRQISAALWFFLRWVVHYGRHVGKKNKAYLSGLTVTEVEQLAAVFVHEKLQPRLRKIMLHRLREHRQHGDVIILLTGTPDFIAAPLAELLGADAWCATQCAIQDDHFIAAAPPIHPFAQEKLQRARETCHQHHLSLSECTAYADSTHDLPLMLHVKQPIAVQPDNSLHQVAAKEGWAII